MTQFGSFGSVDIAEVVCQILQLQWQGMVRVVHIGSSLLDFILLPVDTLERIVDLCRNNCVSLEAGQRRHYMASDVCPKLDQFEHQQKKWTVFLEKLGRLTDHVSFMFCQVEVIGDLSSIYMGVFAALTNEMQTKFGLEPMGGVIRFSVLWQDNEQS